MRFASNTLKPRAVVVLGAGLLAITGRNRFYGQGERDPHEARFGTTRGSFSTLSSQPGAALLASRAQQPSDQPNRRAGDATSRAVAVPLPAAATATLDVAPRAQARRVTITHLLELSPTPR